MKQEDVVIGETYSGRKMGPNRYRVVVEPKVPTRFIRATRQRKITT